MELLPHDALSIFNAITAAIRLSLDARNVFEVKWSLNSRYLAYGNSSYNLCILEIRCHDVRG